MVGAPPPTPPFADAPFTPVRATWLGGYAGGVARALGRLRPALVEVHNRPDLALALARRWPVTLILNNDPQSMRATRTPAERRRLLGRVTVATASSWLAGRFIDGVSDPPHHPTVLPNCLDLAEVPQPDAGRERVILFAGRVVADKGADAFVAACALALPRLPGWRAAMIGGDRFGPDNPETPFLRALRPRAAAAGVAMLGYRPHADVLAAMARAAIVVVPSRWPEPFGLVAVEAMACGAALLCSNRGGLAEVTGDAAEAIDPDDALAFAEAIMAVAGDPARLTALAQRGRARAGAFDVPAVGPTLDALRRSCLARFPRASRPPI